VASGWDSENRGRGIDGDQYFIVAMVPFFVLYDRFDEAGVGGSLMLCISEVRCLATVIDVPNRILNGVLENWVWPRMPVSPQEQFLTLEIPK